MSLLSAKWSVVDIKFVEDWGETISLETLKEHKEAELSGLVLFKQPRLSVQPISEAHYEFIRGLRNIPQK